MSSSCQLCLLSKFKLAKHLTMKSANIVHFVHHLFNGHGQGHYDLISVIFANLVTLQSKSSSWMDLWWTPEDHVVDVLIIDQ